MDRAERALLATTVEDALAKAADGEADTVLAGLGWFEMLADEPRDATAIVCEALGRTNAASGVLDDVLAAALGAQPRADLAVLLPPFALWAPPGTDGLATARLASAADLLVGGTVVPVGSVTVEAVAGVDPAGGWHRVHVAVPVEIDAAQWARAVAAGRRAIAHQCLGAARAVLALACAHAVERVQFDRPIARFQAVRHRLAEALVAIESLDAALGAAWDEPNDLTAALAKAIASRTVHTVSAHCQQVLAGIGFTTDHAFHRYAKRMMALDGIFGRGDDVVHAIGRELLTARDVPMLIDL